MKPICAVDKDFVFLTKRILRQPNGTTLDPIVSTSTISKFKTLTNLCVFRQCRRSIYNYVTARWRCLIATPSLYGDLEI